MTALISTPEALQEQIRKPQDLNVQSLMPEAPAYYHRLIAPPSEMVDFATFINSDLAATRLVLYERHPKRALRRLAYAALWQPLIPFDLLSQICAPDISPLLEAEDPFSLLFGFEFCRHRISDDPNLADLGASFLTKLLNDGRHSTERCTLFSALALITTVNLRRSAKAQVAPLYWVRFAALTHAGVLTDGLSRVPNPDKFLRWSAQSFYPDYIWHGVVDQRDAPRWNPDWIDPEHLYAELVGRVQNALQMVPADACPTQWTSAVEVAVARLQKAGRIIATAFPGPFDDFQQTVPTPAIAAITAIEEKLEKATVPSDVPELFAVANLIAPSCRMLAAIQRFLELPLDEPLVKDEPELPFLRLFAQIAGAARSVAIANAVINRCLARVNASGYPVTDLFGVMAVACAAYADHQEYAELLGRTAANTCFAVDEAGMLSQLENIFNILRLRDERLAPSLAKARAIARLKRERV